MLRLLIVLVVLGLAIYLTVRLVQQGGTGGGRGPGGTLRPRTPRPPARPQGPDDDDDFLRDLDRRRRQPEDPDA